MDAPRESRKIWSCRPSWTDDGASTRGVDAIFGYAVRPDPALRRALGRLPEDDVRAASSTFGALGQGEAGRRVRRVRSCLPQLDLTSGGLGPRRSVFGVGRERHVEAARFLVLPHPRYPHIFLLLPRSRSSLPRRIRAADPSSTLGLSSAHIVRRVDEGAPRTPGPHVIPVARPESDWREVDPARTGATRRAVANYGGAARATPSRAARPSTGSSAARRPRRGCSRARRPRGPCPAARPTGRRS